MLSWRVQLKTKEVFKTVLGFLNRKNPKNSSCFQVLSDIFSAPSVIPGCMTQSNNLKMISSMSYLSQLPIDTPSLTLPSQSILSSGPLASIIVEIVQSDGFKPWTADWVAGSGGPITEGICRNPREYSSWAILDKNSTQLAIVSDNCPSSHSSDVLADLVSV